MFKPTLSTALDKLKKEYNLSIEDSLLIEKFVNMKAEKRAVITEYILEAADYLREKSEDATPLITPDISKKLETLFPPVDIDDSSKFNAE